MRPSRLFDQLKVLLVATHRCVISDKDGAVFAPVLLSGDPISVMYQYAWFDRQFVLLTLSWQGNKIVGGR